MHVLTSVEEAYSGSGVLRPAGIATSWYYLVAYESDLI